MYALLLIPLLFGALGDFQTSFCYVGIFGISGFLECDHIKDTLLFNPGLGVDMSLDLVNDTISINFHLPKLHNYQLDLYNFTEGDLIYNLDDHAYNFFDGAVWLPLIQPQP